MTTQTPFFPAHPIAIRFEMVRAWLDTLPEILRLEAVDGAIAVYDQRRAVMQRLARRSGHFRVTVIDCATVGRFNYYFELAAETLVLVAIELDAPPPTETDGRSMTAAVVVQKGTRIRIFATAGRSTTRLQSVRPAMVHPPVRTAATRPGGGGTAATATAAYSAPPPPAGATLAVAGGNAGGHHDLRPGNGTGGIKAEHAGNFDVRRALVVELTTWLTLHDWQAAGRPARLARIGRDKAVDQAEHVAAFLTAAVGATGTLPRHRRRRIERAVAMLGKNGLDGSSRLSWQAVARLIRALRPVMLKHQLRDQLGRTPDLGSTKPTRDPLAVLRAKLGVFLLVDTDEGDNRSERTSLVVR